jgi:hypothetical protein
MLEDPIVEELHRIREEMLEEHGGLQGLVRHLRDVQAQMAKPPVTLEPKLPVETKRSASSRA